MRSLIFRFGDVAAFSAAMSETVGSLPLPDGQTVGDGEWVLAIFEIGSRRRATAAAARGVRAAGDTHLEFERRDWERLTSFVAARSEHMRVARPVSTPPSGATAPLASTSPGRRTPESERAPRAAADDPPVSRRLDDDPPPSIRMPFGARVLVVDESAGGDELRAHLVELGLVVELVATTKRAEERLRAKAFDAIVVDAQCACSDPSGFVGRLRRDPRVGDVPVLLVSAKPTSRDVVDAFACGCDDFLPKPFRTPELAARIFGLLRRARTATKAAGSTGR